MPGNPHFSTCADGARFVFAACQPMPIPDRCAFKRLFFGPEEGGELHADFWPTILFLPRFGGQDSQEQKKGAAVQNFGWRDFQVEMCFEKPFA